MKWSWLSAYLDQTAYSQVLIYKHLWTKMNGTQKSGLFYYIMLIYAKMEQMQAQKSIKSQEYSNKLKMISSLISRPRTDNLRSQAMIQITQTTQMKHRSIH